MRISRKLEPTTGDYKISIYKKYFKWKLYEVTRNTKEWITEFKLIRGYLQMLDVRIEGL